MSFRRLSATSLLLLSAIGGTGCTSEKDLGDRSPEAGAGSGASGTVRGTIGGRAFVPTSAFAHAGLGYVHGEVDVPAIDLIFSSASDACSTVKKDQYEPGETYVQIFNVRAELGTDTASDAKYAVVDTSCASGTELQEGDGLASHSQVAEAGAKVTFTRIDAERVEGTVTMSFVDLSSFEGTFSLVPCAGGDSGFGNDPTCK